MERYELFSLIFIVFHSKYTMQEFFYYIDGIIISLTMISTFMNNYELKG